MVIHERRTGIAFIYGDYNIWIKHDFYGDKFYDLKYEVMRNMLGQIVLLIEGIIIIKENGLVGLNTIEDVDIVINHWMNIDDIKHENNND